MQLGETILGIGVLAYGLTSYRKAVLTTWNEVNCRSWRWLLCIVFSHNRFHGGRHLGSKLLFCVLRINVSTRFDLTTWLAPQPSEIRKLQNSTRYCSWYSMILLL